MAWLTSVMKMENEDEFVLCGFIVHSQWLKWFCEAGGAHLTKPGWSKPHTHSNPH